MENKWKGEESQDGEGTQGPEEKRAKSRAEAGQDNTDGWKGSMADKKSI
jgi:hypothetical protein